MTFPWLEAAIRDLADRRIDLPHTILITGIEGLGKLDLANSIAQSLLCLDVQYGFSCNKCQSCILFLGGNHPDYHLLTNEYTVQDRPNPITSAGNRYLLETERTIAKRKTLRRSINVEQVRVLTDELITTPHLGVSKSVVIYPANELNINAANALLKTLEEPPQRTYFILATAFPQFIAPTIRSRCIEYKVPTPPIEQTISWLDTAHSLNQDQLQTLLKFWHGSPLKTRLSIENDSWKTTVSLVSDVEGALKRQVSVEALYQKWNQLETRIPLQWLQLEIINAFRYAVGAEASETGRLLFDRIGLETGLELYKKIGLFLTWPINAVDERLFFESVFSDLMGRNRQEHERT